jgi:hypothetical protein
MKREHIIIAVLAVWAFAATWLLAEAWQQDCSVPDYDKIRALARCDR